MIRTWTTALLFGLVLWAPSVQAQDIFCSQRSTLSLPICTGVPLADQGGAAPIIEFTDAPVCCQVYPSKQCSHDWQQVFYNSLHHTKNNLWSDFRNHYCWENLGYMALGVAVAAPMANTDFDNNFSDWYQRRVRSDQTDDFSRHVKTVGDHELVVPIYLAAIAGGWMLRDYECGTTTEQWSRRTLRAMIVGAPAVGVLQYGLGGHRPDEGSSQWRPFDDTNGVGGHVFIGALPFLTAAAMTENRWAKVALCGGSFLTGWSRLNDDAHTISQVALGWWLAYLAVQSVNRTECQRQFMLMPYSGPEEVGVNMHFRF